jgi:hypothetical protein
MNIRTIFAFALDGLRLCHFGDFGQASLRPPRRSSASCSRGW